MLKLFAHILLALSIVATSGIPVSIDYCRALMAGETCDLDCADAVCCESFEAEAESGDDCCGTTVVVSALDLDVTTTVVTKIPDVPSSTMLAELEPVAVRAIASDVSTTWAAWAQPPPAPPDVLCCFRI